MQIERRIHPRADVEIPVELINCMGDSAQGNILNVSEGGVLVAGDASLDRLHHAMAGVELELSLSFRLRGELIRCDARVSYVRRQSQQEYWFCLAFSWLERSGDALFCSEIHR